MRTITTNIYELEELTEEVQLVAIENYKNDNYHRLFDWYDSEEMKKDMEEKLAENGYLDMDINYSLSNSQGDGVRFTGEIFEGAIKDLTVKLMLEGEFKVLDIFDEIGFSIYGNISANSHRYYHSNTMDIALGSEIDNYYKEEFEEIYPGVSFDLLQGFLRNLEELIDQDTKQLCYELEREGYKEIEYHYSDEYVRDLLINEGMEFEVDGSLWS